MNKNKFKISLSDMLQRNIKIEQKHAQKSIKMTRWN